jgi:hypothetical protein
MQVQVKHNGTNITGFVDRYDREHKICTGIGTLEVEVANTINRTFDPWDTMDIHENGDFKVRYYVSSVENTNPRGTMVIHCQDVSKRLVDYFIPDSYVIDYPSYTRTWIEQFLTEAGLDYTFTTASQGNLISNYTQLGLQPAYEQILSLLQMSGWYMFFDGNERAVIGTLETNLAASGGSLGKTDILSIAKISDDKMLRNRALVLGTYDPFEMAYATADVSVHTRWNYDHRDQRAVVISNHNIPNRGTAFAMANQIIKEFARITVEKHIQAWGARDFILGDALNVTSNVWRGKGLITTFGVSMSKDGLVTNVILDERCPRLFGFFDFGDYVYVGTYGDGVWRKHIKFDHTWLNFSTGLTDLAVTDLHINNGIFGSVATSGEMYRAVSDVPWYPITVTGLMSSRENVVASGVPVEWTTFSGICGRATIVDKITNNLKFGVDTESGINYGDYFLNYSGWFGPISFSGITMSGVTESGIHRGWVLEYDPYTGQLVGGLGSGIYPISVSGNYNFSVIDLENDGVNDYVSVATFSGGMVTHDAGFDFGSHTTHPPHSTGDPNSKAGYSLATYELEGQSLYDNLSLAASNCFSVFHNELLDERDILWIDATSNVITFRKTHFFKAFDPFLGYDAVDEDITQSPTQTFSVTIPNFCAISRVSSTVYRFFYNIFSVGTRTTNGTLVTYYREWDTIANTVGSEVVLDTITDTPPTVDPGASEFSRHSSFITIDQKIYAALVHLCSAGSNRNAANQILIHTHIIDINSLNVDSGLRATFDFEVAEPFPGPQWCLDGLIGGGVTLYIALLQKGTLPNFSFFVREKNHSSISSATDLRNYIITSPDMVSFNITTVQTATSSTQADYMNNTAGTADSQAGRNQLTDDSILLYLRDATGTQRPTYAFNGTTVTIGDYPTDVPFYWKSANIYPMFNNIRNEYVAKDGSDWWWIDAASMIQSFNIEFSPDYIIIKPFSTSAEPLEQFYWYATRDADLEKVILVTYRAGNIWTAIDPFVSFTFTNTKGIVSGNMYIDTPNTAGILSVLYIDNIYPPTGGGTFLVLRREGMDYTVIQEEAYPIRIDISNNTPLLTVGSGDRSFVSNFVYDSELLQVLPAPGASVQVEDYRYTYLEPTYSGVALSGLALQSMGLYIASSGIFGFDTATYSGGFTLYDSIPSGYGTRIETSNYGMGGQYIFITTSGDIQDFYQRDPGGFTFTSYSGLPQSRATIIRLDDRI